MYELSRGLFVFVWVARLNDASSECSRHRCDWHVGLPDLREIFSREEIDQLLTRVVQSGVIRCTRFVIRTGYKDEPDLDNDGKPMTRRTTPMHQKILFPRARGTTWDTIIRDLFKIYNRFDVNYTDESGLSHFHVACMSGYLYVVKKLFKLVQDPNFPVRETGDSPLHLALLYGKKKVAECLLRRGANPNLVNAEGLTPLHMICVGGNDDDLAEMLFKFSNDKHQPVEVDASDELGMHCLGAGVGGQSSPNGLGAPGSLLNVVRALGVLVSEGRIQGGPRGYKEGPHCVAPLQAAPNNHVCKKDNYLCDRYLVLVREISERLECGTYLCVEVVLCSDCPCGLIKSKNEHRVLSSSSLAAPWQQSSEMLLEYWCICVVASKNQETMNSQGLYQAVRSRLHFSQVAAWWSRTKGLNPSYVATRIVQQPINGEDHLRRFRETPVEHTFPLAGVGDGNSLKVTMWALPRMDETPVLKCQAHPELTATSTATSAQTSTSELQAEGMESGATQTSSCPRAATPTKLLIPTDSGCNGENSAASPGEPGGVIDGLLVAEPGPASGATSSEPGQHVGNGMSSSAPNNSLAGGGDAKFVYYMSSFRSTAQLNECNQPGKHNCPCAAATAEEDDETTSSAPPRVERKRRRSLPCGPPPASYSAPPPSLNNSPPERTSLEQHLPALREANPDQSLGPAGVDNLDSLDNLESSFRIQLSIDEHQQKQQQQQQCSAKHLEKRLKRSYSEEQAPPSSVATSSHAPSCSEPKVPSSTRSPTADKGSTRVTNLRLNPLLHPEAADACQKQSAGILDWISSRVPRNSGSSKQTSIVGRCESSSASGRRNCNLDLSPREFDEVLAVLRARTPLGRRRTGLRTAKRRDKYDRLVNEQTHSSQPQSPTATQRQQTLQPPPQQQPQQQQSCNKAEVLLGAILRSSSKETVEPIDPSQLSQVSDVSTVINKRFFQLKHLFTRNEQQQLPQHPQLAACEHRAKRRIDFSDSTEDEEDEDERNEAAQEKPLEEQESKSNAKLKAELPLVSVSLDVDNANATFEDEVDKGNVPSMKDQERFRRSLENAASMVFHSRTGLPLTSSPAPLRRGSCCFDFDSSLNSVSSKRSQFHLN
ncbi:unnamed protein product [Trichogramma brassicae]|uniref:Uncharacterized protein n=1 Tax=Trichogramma brassicae TaxID=86971 RepID=A0A6H5IXK0_9HYME|nr:unnamed protein product [Trichogramma brassicae]